MSERPDPRAVDPGALGEVTDFGQNLAQSWLWRGAVGFNAVILVVALTAAQLRGA